MKMFKLLVIAALVSMVAAPAGNLFITDAYAKNAKKEHKKLTPEQEKAKAERKAARDAAKQACAKEKDPKACLAEKMKAAKAAALAKKTTEKK